MEVGEYFEPYLTKINLIKDNEKLTDWLIFYNFNRPHQTLGYKTPIEWYNDYKLNRVLPMYPTFNNTLKLKKNMVKY